MSQLLFVLKLPAFVDHFIVSIGVFFQCLTNFLLIIVALHPESNNTRSVCFCAVFNGSLSLIYPMVIVERSSTLVLFLGRNNEAVEAKHSIFSHIILLPLIFLVRLSRANPQLGHAQISHETF